MAEKKLRTCGLCKASYSYCPHCGEDKGKEAWHIMWDTENCRDIDTILSHYGAGVIDAETAATLLKSKDVSRKEFWNDSFKAAYDEIMKEAPVVKKTVSATPKVEPKEEPHTSISEEIKKHNKKATVTKATKKV